MSEKLSEVGRGVEKGSCREVQTWRVRVSSLSPPSLVDTFTSRRVPSGVVSGDGLACGGVDRRSGREQEGEGITLSPSPPFHKQSLSGGGARGSSRVLSACPSLPE